jgi:hypothetical protein
MLSNGKMAESVLEKYAAFLPFNGLGLSAINFVQVPFWTGWNLYLMNELYFGCKKLKLFYIAGTLVGTFAGCLLLIFFKCLAQHTTVFNVCDSVAFCFQM